MTRTDNVQTRAETGVANPPRALANNSPPRRTSALLSSEVPPHLTGHIPSTGPTMASYRNIVASRPPPLREETTALISACSSEDAESPIEPDRSLNETLVIVSKDINYEEINELTSSEARVFLLDHEESEGNELEWTTVNRRHHAYGSGSKEGTRNASKRRVHMVHAPTKAQEQMFKPAAAISLTAIEKQGRSSRLRRRRKNLAIRKHRSSSRGKNLSNLKEKCIDVPKNVQVDITHLIRDSESLNAATQMLAAALNAINQWNEKATDKNMNSCLKLCGEREGTHQSLHPHAIQSADPASPTAQMANSCYLVSVVLENVDRRQFRWRKLSSLRSLAPDPGSSSDDSESDNGLSRSIMIGGPEVDETPLSSHSGQRPQRRSENKLVSGNTDTRTSHHCVLKSTAYPYRGNLKVQIQLRHSERISTSTEKEEQNLLKFCDKSFDCCFPSISEYARCNDELESQFSSQELFDILRVSDILPDRDKYIKFWYESLAGRRPVVLTRLKGLRASQANSKISLWSWEQTTVQAEIVQISKNIAERRDHELGLSTSESPDMEPTSDRLGAELRSKFRERTPENAARSALTGPCTQIGTSSQLVSQFWSRALQQSSKHHEKPPPHMRTLNKGLGSPHHPSGPSTSQHDCAMRRQSLSKAHMSAKKCINLLLPVVSLLCLASVLLVVVYGHIGRSVPTCAMRSANASESLGASRFNIEPTITEFENDNSVDSESEVFDSLPIGVMFNKAMLTDSEAPQTRELSEHSINEPAPTPVWPGPLRIDRWTKHYLYWNEADILARRQIYNCYASAAAMDANSILTPEQLYPRDNLNNLCNSRLELGFHAKNHIFNSRSDYLMDDREVNEQVAIYKSPHENPYCDISSHWYAKRHWQSKVLYLDQQVAHRAIGAKINAVAAKVLTDGVASYYPYTDPTLNIEVKLLYVAILCDKPEDVIGNIGSKILTRMPESSLEDLLFDSVEWYGHWHYINQLNLLPSAKTYLPRKLTSLANNAMTKVELGFPTEIQVSPKWDRNCNKTVEPGDLPSLIAVPNESECHDDETTGDEDAHHSHHCCHNCDCQRIMFRSWNEITYLHRPSKPYGLEGEIKTEDLVEYPLENANVQIRHILTTLKEIVRVLMESHCQTASEGPAVVDTYEERDMRSKITCTRVVMYGACDRLVPCVEAQFDSARLRAWDALSVESFKWYAEKRLHDCSPCCPWKTVRRSIKQHCDHSMEHILEPFAAVLLVVLHVDPPSADERVNRTRSSFVFAISYWLDLGRLVKLVITSTAKKRRTAAVLPRSRIGNPSFKFVGCPEQITAMGGLTSPVVATLTARPPSEDREERTVDFELELRRVQVDKNKCLSLQQHAVQEKENWRTPPRPQAFSAKVWVMVNGPGQLAIATRAATGRLLLETGISWHFVFSMLADLELMDPDQLTVRRKLLNSLMSQQLVMLGSPPIVDLIPIRRPKYQGIKEELTSDTRHSSINLNSILNMTRWYQCQSVADLESYLARMVPVGSDKVHRSRSGAEIMLMVALILFEDDQRAEGLDAHDGLRVSRHDERSLSCRDVDETRMGLPCVQVVNHTILSMDESKTHQQRKFTEKMPYICFVPEYLEGRKEGGYMGTTKLVSYIPPETCWSVNPPELWTIANLKERSKNSHNLIAASSDAAGMLKHATAGQLELHTMLYVKNAFERKGLVLEHCEHATTTTLDDDTSVINHVNQWYLFRVRPLLPGVDRFGLFMETHLDAIVVDSDKLNKPMHVHLDDMMIVIYYSDNPNDCLNHVKTVLNILLQKELYLSQTKPHSVKLVWRLLGHMIEVQGIQIDVDCILNLKGRATRSRNLSRDFIGSVEYLIIDIPHFHIPMRLLSSWAEDTGPLRRNCAGRSVFEKAKDPYHGIKDHRWVSLSYPKGAVPEWMTTEGVSKISDVSSQRNEWKRIKMSAFSLAKWNTARPTYAMHDIGMRAGVGIVLSYSDILLETQFSWLIGHKRLMHSLNEENLFNLQSQRLKEFELGSVDFPVNYVEESKNEVADKLSRLYATYSHAIEHAEVEIISCDVEMSTVLKLQMMTAIEAQKPMKRNTAMRCPQAIERGPWDLSEPIESTCFILECPAGRKEGGCTSQTHKNNCTNNSNCGSSMKDKVVTAESAVVTRALSSSDVPNSDHETLEVAATTLVPHSQFESNDSSEHADFTFTKMLHQCIHPNQTDWLFIAIEFAIQVNSPKSESISYYALFFPNPDMPGPGILMIQVWTSASATVTEYTSVRELALRKKLTLSLRSAYDNIIVMAASTTTQARDTNQKRQVVLPAIPLKFGDLVYLSMKNISLLQGLARKLILRFIDACYKIINEPGDASTQLDPSSGNLKKPQPGIRVIFLTSSSLLHIYATNDDHSFQDDPDGEWTLTINRIWTPVRSKLEADLAFEISSRWKSDYLDLQRIHHIAHLLVLKGTGTSEDDLQSLLTRLPSPLPNSHTITVPFLHFHFAIPFPFQPSFISPTVDLEHHHFHLPYPLVDCQQFAPISSMQPLVNHPGCHFITTSSLVQFSTQLQYMNTSSRARDSTIRVTISGSKILCHPNLNIPPTASLIAFLIRPIGTSRLLQQKPSRNTLQRKQPLTNLIRLRLELQCIK